MEKQQSISDYCEGFKASGEGWNGEYGLKDMLDVAGEIDAEDYYNKTYILLQPYFVLVNRFLFMLIITISR